jgi:LemA protein
MAGKFWTTGKIAIAIVALILLVFLVFLPVGAYNSFVTKSQDVSAKWSEVENQYQRQADLIPNLVAVVSSYAGFESSLLTNLTNLRSQWQASLSSDLVQRDQTGVEMTSALARLIAVAENYPDLKANTQYTALSDELSGSQNRIVVARGRYIESIQSYNTATVTFPNNIYAGLFGFSQKQYYQAPPGSLVTPSLGNASLP